MRLIRDRADGVGADYAKTVENVEAIRTPAPDRVEFDFKESLAEGITLGNFRFLPILPAHVYGPVAEKGDAALKRYDRRCRR